MHFRLPIRALGFAVLMIVVLLTGVDLEAQSVGGSDNTELNRQQLYKINVQQQKIRRQEELLENLQHKLIDSENKRADALSRQVELGVSTEAFPEIMKNLHTAKVELMIDIAGLEARRKFLLDYERNSQAKVNSDVLAPLNEILDLEKKNLDRAKALVERAAVSASELQNAKRRVLMAEIQLAEAEDSTGSSELRRELLETSMQRAEKQARLDQTSEILDSLTSSRLLFETDASIQEQIRMLRSQISNENLKLLSHREALEFLMEGREPEPEDR